VASLVLGIASIVICWCYVVPPLICAILALVFHSSAMRDIHAGAANPDSAGMARAGRICGIIGLVVTVGLWVVIGVALIARG
jgi:ABC-type arginine/histidine transport system permease subunit